MPQYQHDVSQSFLLSWMLDKPWRTGRHVERNIYVMVGDKPDNQSDTLIGHMDTGPLAKYVVEGHNRELEERNSR